MPKKNTERIEQDIKIEIRFILPKKKQQHIYVARNLKRNCFYYHEGSNYAISTKKMVIDRFMAHYDRCETGKCLFAKLQKLPYRLKLKKGEQVRIPIDVDKAEVV